MDSDANFKATISVTTELPIYAGIVMADVHLVASPGDVATALTALRAADVVGFDTESKPTFSKGEVTTGPHLIQLATDTKVYLLQINSRSAPQILDLAREILEADYILKVGFGLASDTSRLKTKLSIDSKNVLDLSIALPRIRKQETMGARTAVEKYFGKRLKKSKRISTSNWALPQLTDRQMLYAADDAQVALRIYRQAFRCE
jgi:RNA polymerase sigma factor for flagellar operon FliA